ncbi:MAG: hypothetical protein HQL67_03160 [Magnetococcales bacterium]|nr:hypothetical protein [Magnetococcales bacterium]
MGYKFDPQDSMNGYRLVGVKGRLPLLDTRQGAFQVSLDLLARQLESTEPGLESTLTTFSIWMEKLIPIKLVAYWNPRNRHYGIKHANGGLIEPELLDMSQEIIKGPLPRISHWRQQNWLFHLWAGEPLDRWDRFLVVESGTGMTVRESNQLLEEALEILKEPLRNSPVQNA